MTSLDHLPHNFEAEQALLGAILMSNSAYQHVAEFLRQEHFADPLHGKLYAAAGKLVDRGQVVNALTLKTYAEQDADLKAAGGNAYLARLVAASVHALDAVILGDRPAPFAAFARGIAEPSEALAARPVVHFVEELAALFGGTGRGDSADDHALVDQSGEQPEARSLEMLADVMDD